MVCFWCRSPRTHEFSGSALPFVHDLRTLFGQAPLTVPGGPMRCRSLNFEKCRAAELRNCSIRPMFSSPYPSHASCCGLPLGQLSVAGWWDIARRRAGRSYTRRISNYMVVAGQTPLFGDQVRHRGCRADITCRRDHCQAAFDLLALSRS